MSIKAPFKQWGLEFNKSEISNYLSAGHKCILVIIDYFTKWVEAIPTRKETHQVVMEFVFNNMICRFGVPAKIIYNNAMSFRV